MSDDNMLDLNSFMRANAIAFWNKEIKIVGGSIPSSGGALDALKTEIAVRRDNAPFLGLIQPGDILKCRLYGQEQDCRCIRADEETITMLVWI